MHVCRIFYFRFASVGVANRQLVLCESSFSLLDSSVDCRAYYRGLVFQTDTLFLIKVCS